MLVGGAGVGIANMELYFTKEGGFKNFFFGQRKKKKKIIIIIIIIIKLCIPSDHRPMTPRSHHDHTLELSICF